MQSQFHAAVFPNPFEPLAAGGADAACHPSLRRLRSRRDLRAAYDALDEGTKALISDKTGTFYSHNTRDWLQVDAGAEERKAHPPVQWPLVRTHPGSQRKVLWCDSKVARISGMTTPEGRALAHELIEHIGQRERVHSHRWKSGDLVMYDNRSALHRGRRFNLDERREMRRVGIGPLRRLKRL